MTNWEKRQFGKNKKFISFLKCSNWEKFVEKISEPNWWKHLMNSLYNMKSTHVEKVSLNEDSLSLPILVD